MCCGWQQESIIRVACDVVYTQPKEASVLLVASKVDLYVIEHEGWLKHPKFPSIVKLSSETPHWGF